MRGWHSANKSPDNNVFANGSFPAVMVVASMVESATLELINLSYDSLESARLLTRLSKISFNSSIIFSRVTSNYYIHV